MDKWLKIYRSPDDEGGGGDDAGDAGDAGGGDNAAAAAAPPDVMTMKLDGDKIPEKFRGKSVSDALGVYGNAEKQLSKQAEKIKALEKKIAETPDAKDNGQLEAERDIFIKALDAAKQTGEIPDDLRTSLREQSFTDDDLDLLARGIRGETLRIVANAQSAIAQEFEGLEVDVPALAQYARESGKYSEEDLAAFDRMLMRHNDISGLRIVINDLQKEGIDVTGITSEALNQPAATRKRGLPPVAKGNMAAVAGEDSFPSQAAYIAARAKAEFENDHVAMAEVQKKLERSNFSKWPERTTFTPE